MISKFIPPLHAFEAWRDAARDLLMAQVPPAQVQWTDAASQDELFGTSQLPSVSHQREIKVPPDFLTLARQVAAHRSDERFSRLYTVLWRLLEQPTLLGNPADADVRHLNVMAKSVSRDCHKMKAFVRFRELSLRAERRVFGAWFEPEHHIVTLTGPFFARRFADMDWAISTPKGVSLFVDGVLSYALPDGQRHAAPDVTENLWRTYYANVFNPARLKVKAMKSEMPKKYWKNLPEAALIPDLIAGAAARAQQMRERMPSVPPPHLAKFKAPEVTRPVGGENVPASLDAARNAAAHCTRCPLHCHATQTVFGEGNENAAIMFVGEQPGDHEDIEGKPFVGPAGQLFDEGIRAAGINRNDVYVTNAVKHFKFSPRGKRRIHERPNRSEIQHCKWWLDTELRLVKPRLVVALGATAMFALTGKTHAIHSSRGMLHQTAGGPPMFATYHPSAVLRNPVKGENIRQMLFEDIGRVQSILHQLAEM